MSLINKIKYFDDQFDLFRGVTFQDGIKPKGYVGNNNYYFPSFYDIGQRVQFLDYKENSYIRAIIFTNSKIRYSLFLEVRPDFHATLHSVDSAMIVKGYDERMDFGEDNYS